MAKLKNDGHERFCQEYVKDLNQTQAYIRSGYEEKGANVNASKLMANNNIHERIQELQRDIAKRNGVTASDIASEFKKIGYSNILDLIDDKGKLVNLKELPREVGACISSVKEITSPNGETKIEFKFWDKTKALEALGKHIGWFEIDNEQKREKEDFSKSSTEELIARAEAIEKIDHEKK